MTSPWFLLLLPLGACVGGGVKVPPDTGVTGTSTSDLTASIGPKGPKTDDDLVVTVVGDGAPFTYVWSQDGVERSDLTEDTVPAKETTKGEFWKVTVKSDQGGETTAQATIQNTPPQLSALSVDPQDPVSGEDISAVANGEDADGDDITVSYEWLLDGSSVGDSSDTLSGKETDRGQHLKVTGTPSDGEDDGDPMTAEADIGNGLPVILSASLSPGKPSATDDLTVTIKSKDPDNDPVTYNVRWYVDGNLDQVGTSTTLSAGSAQTGQVVYAEIIPNDGTDDGPAFTTANVTIQEGGSTGNGTAAIFFHGSVAGNKTTMSSGEYGFALYPYDFATDHSDITVSPLCYAWVTLTQGSAVSTPCSQCDYSYTIASDNGTGSSGSDCASLAGVSAYMDESVLNSYLGPGAPYEVDFGIGFTATSQYGFSTIYMYTPSNGWFLFAYDYDSVSAGFNSSASGAGGTIDWTRAIQDASGYEYYYSY